MTTLRASGTRRPAGRAIPGLAALLALLVAGCGLAFGPTAGPSNPSQPAALATATPGASPSRAASPTPSPRPSPSPSLDAERIARLQSALQGVLASEKLPGISVAMTFPDGSTWSSAVGYADLTTKRPMTTSTVFSAGSLTKTFVAAMVLRLSEEGLLGLDDPLSRWIPTYPNGSKITIRQLLDHSSGIRDFAGAPGFDSAMWASPGKLWTASQLQPFLGPPYFAPGTGWHYSNENYVLLGQVVQKAAGVPIATLLDIGFFEPLGLTSTVLQGAQPIVGPLAHGYQSPTRTRGPVDITGASTMLPFPAVASAFGSSGALASTPSDLARWVSLLYHGQVLSVASTLEMSDTTPTEKLKGARPYGLGTEVFPIDGHVAFGHHGHLIGFWTAAAWIPAQQIGIAVMTNGDWGDPTAIASLLLKAYLATPVSPSPSPLASSSPSPAPSPSAPVPSPSEFDVTPVTVTPRP